MTGKPDAPIIVKRPKKGHGHGGHGSGTWKLAYADFVTAMMAFFILLWLLAITTDEQKLGIANYFMPTTFEKGPTGSVGFTGGASTVEDGSLNATPMSTPSIMMGLPPDDGDSSSRTPGDLEHLGEAERERLIEQAEEREFRRIRDELREALASSEELTELARNLAIDRTPEGIRIQIVDQDQRSMFPLSSARMLGEMERLIEQIVRVIKVTNKRVAVSGHTDATPFRSTSQQDNWQLSADRANAARRALVAAGLEDARIARVTGMADTEPIDPDAPDAAVNRRISIILLSERGRGGA